MIILFHTHVLSQLRDHEQDGQMFLRGQYYSTFTTVSLSPLSRVSRSFSIIEIRHCCAL